MSQDTHTSPYSDEITTPSDVEFYLHSKPKANTLSAYEAEILKYVNLRWSAYNLGIGLAELNRRFSPLTAKFGVTTAHIAREWCRKGELTTARYKQNLVLFPKDYMDILPDGNSEGIEHAMQSLLEASLSREPRVKPSKVKRSF